MTVLTLRIVLKTYMEGLAQRKHSVNSRVLFSIMLEPVEVMLVVMSSGSQSVFWRPLEVPENIIIT